LWKEKKVPPLPPDYTKYLGRYNWTGGFDPLKIYVEDDQILLAHLDQNMNTYSVANMTYFDQDVFRIQLLGMKKKIRNTAEDIMFIL